MREIDAAQVAADLLDPPKTGVLRFYDDPVGFVENCFKWKPGKGIAPYQGENMRALVEHQRLAVRGPRGLGKTCTHAWITLWFALTREAAGDDWKTICTASVYRQLKDYFWHEVERKWAPVIEWELVGREPFKTAIEMMRDELRLRHGSVTLAAATDPAKIEGAHADQLLYIYDEAKSIPDEIFDSAEGAFSGAGDDAEQVAYVIASSTPGAPEGRFFDIHEGADGLRDWHVRHVSKEEVIAAGRMSAEWARRREEQYGKDSSWFQNHVEGNFAAEAFDGVIRQVNLEEAHERWLELGLPRATYTGQFAIPDLSSLGPLQAVGVDLAAGGQDRSVYALRYGTTIGCLMLRPQQKDTMVPTAEVANLLRSAEHQPVGVIDASGLGIPISDRLKELGLAIKPFVAAEGTNARVRATMQSFVDVRSAAWWGLREMLEPSSGLELAIPPDDQLTADLLAPKWTEESSGRIKVESKKDIRKRLKRSTDAGDAVVQVFWRGAQRAASGPVFGQQPKESRWSSLKPGAASVYAGGR